MKKKIAIWLSLILFGVVITLFSIIPLRSQVMEIAGLAVAETDLIWNHLKDGAIGDAQLKGLAASGGYMYDPIGADWNRVRGDTTDGVWVNVKSTVAPTIAGTKTPSDAFANPTDALDTWSFTGLYNGTTWDRARGDTTNGMWTNIKASIDLPVHTTTSSTITADQVTVDDTGGGILIIAANANRKSVIIRNLGADDMYVGPTATLTTATGMLVKMDESIVLDRTTAAIYGITAAAGSTTVAYIEE